MSLAAPQDWPLDPQTLQGLALRHTALSCHRPIELPSVTSSCTAEARRKEKETTSPIPLYLGYSGCSSALPAEMQRRVRPRLSSCCLGFSGTIQFFHTCISVTICQLCERFRGLCRGEEEKAMAPHSSTLAWKVPWTEEPDGLQSMGLRRVGHN